MFRHQCESWWKCPAYRQSWSFTTAPNTSRHASAPSTSLPLAMIDTEDQVVPLNMASLVNVLALPMTLVARFRLERRISAPRLEDTVSELQGIFSAGET